jgi:ferric-dicitrate binding protein FerR (iron transport regulator)
MGLQILKNRAEDTACFYTSVTDWAFGPIARGEDAEAQLIVFTEWLEARPEHYDDYELARLWSKFGAEYLPGFKSWMADRYEEIDWNNVKQWTSDYQQALEESHAGGAV